MRFIYLLMAMLCFLLSTYASAAQPVSKPLSIQSYLSQFFQKDEDVKEVFLSRQRDLAQNRALTDVFQNQLTLTPDYTSTELDSPLGGSFEQQRWRLSTRFEQQTPYGLGLNLEGAKFFDDPDPAIGGLDQDWTISLEQSLWNNAFGFAARSAQRQFEQRAQELKFTEKQSLQESCVTGAELYINAYVRMKRNEIAQGRLKDAKRALNISESGFRRRLLRKIDVLTARADYVRVESVAVSRKTDFEKSLSELYFRLEENPQIQSSLDSPEDFFSEVPRLGAFNAETSYQWLSASASTQAEEQSYLETKSRRRSTVNLGASWNQRQTLGATGNSAGQFNLNEINSLNVFLRVELPLINKTWQGEVASQHLNWQLAQVYERRVKKQISDDFRRLQLDEQQSVKSLELTTKSLGFRKKQLTEAQRLLNAGKIEFNDYIQYRDNYFQEQENQLESLSLFWQSRIRQAQYSDKLGAYCMGESA